MRFPIAIQALKSTIVVEASVTGLTNPLKNSAAMPTSVDDQQSVDQKTAVASGESPELLQRDLDDLLDEFDKDWRSDLDYLRQFAVDKQIGAYANEAEIAGELARADLDRRYTCGASVVLDDYLQLFPCIAASPETLLDVAFEEYRARRSRGLPVSPERWRKLPGVDGASWFRELLRSESNPASSLSSSALAGTSPADGVVAGAEPAADMIVDLPVRGQTGRRLGDFELVQLLGSGAFSQVYLARQLSLAGRFVALKLVRQHLQEPTHLARLQHTGIVPLYSLHRIGEYSALCMPYCGATTLADWFSVDRKEGSTHARDGHSFVETVEASNKRLTVHAIMEEAAKASDSAEEQGVTAASATCHESAAVADSLRAWNTTASQPLHGLRGLNTRDFAIWFAHRLASALAHAHLRGIVHGDIKPANVLIRNDGEPAFIDFNLSRDDSASSPQLVGGTLPYMAPEQLESLLSRRSMTSPASDVYSLGIVLFELIEGRLPFSVPRSMSETDLASALSERRCQTLRWENRIATAGMRSIVTKCLACAPDQRYRNAESMLEDIERERLHLPLLHAREPWSAQVRKLTRRFPRLFSGAAITLISSMIIVTLACMSALLWQRSQTLAAERLVVELAHLSSTVPLAALEQQSPTVMSYSQTAERELMEVLSLRDGASLPGTPGLRWLDARQRERANRLLFEHALVMAVVTAERALAASSMPGSSSSVEQLGGPWLNRCAEFPEYSKSSAAFQLLQQLAGKADATSVVEVSQVTSSLDALLLARIALHEDRGSTAAQLLQPLPEDSPFKALFWMTLGQTYLSSRDYDSARLTLSLATAAAPDCSTPFKLRAEAAAGARDFTAAVEDYSKAIELAERKSGLLADRARMHELAGAFELALADVDRALELEPDSNRLLVYRSRLKQRLGRNEEAIEDFRQALQIEPRSELDWISRGLARGNRDPQGALEDLRHALELNPRSTSVLQNIAFIQSDKLHDDAGALESLNRLLEIDPRFELARSGRCVLLARVGKGDQALEDVRYIQTLSKPLPSSIYAVACTFSLLSATDDAYRDEAFRYLTDVTLSGSGYGRDLLDSDPDLTPLRADERFARLRSFIRIIDGEK